MTGNTRIPAQWDAPKDSETWETECIDTGSVVLAMHRDENGRLMVTTEAGGTFPLDINTAH